VARVTIEDLKRIRDESRRTITTRSGEARAKVIIHMGTCGIAAGAREVMGALLQEIEARRLTDILVTTSSCAGLCSQEPMATVELPGRPPLKYVDLTAEKMIRVLHEHVLGGRVVTEFALATGSETTA
jgi:NADP-reducing hydrogenase subunit HndB